MRGGAATSAGREFMKISLMLITPIILFSSNAAHSAFERSVGVGTQYGGLFGVQASFYHSEVKVNFGLGLLGISTGFEYFLTPKNSLGAHAFIVAPVGGYAVSWNHYFNGQKAAGWRVGLDVGNAQAFGDQDVFILPSIGYNFSF